MAFDAAPAPAHPATGRTPEQAQGPRTPLNIIRRPLNPPPMIRIKDRPERPEGDFG